MPITSTSASRPAQERSNITSRSAAAPAKSSAPAKTPVAAKSGGTSSTPRRAASTSSPGTGVYVGYWTPERIAALSLLALNSQAFDPSQHEDAISELYLRAVRALELNPALGPGGVVQAMKWRFCELTRDRRKTKLQVFSYDAPIQGESDDTFEWFLADSKALESVEHREMIAAVKARLSDRDFKLLVWRSQGVPSEDIAKRLRISVRSVDYRMAKARQLARAVLA